MQWLFWYDRKERKGNQLEILETSLEIILNPIPNLPHKPLSLGSQSSPGLHLPST